MLFGEREVGGWGERVGCWEKRERGDGWVLGKEGEIGRDLTAGEEGELGGGLTARERGRRDGGSDIGDSGP